MEQAIRLIAERKIEEAIEQGKFNNLPGHGKPLNLEAFTYVPAEMRPAAILLRNANVEPDWVALDREIATLRAAVVQLWGRAEYEYTLRSGHSEQAFGSWYVQLRGELLLAMRRVNRAILKRDTARGALPALNFSYAAADELERFQSLYPPPPGYGHTAADSERSGSAIRTAALADYRADRTG